MKRRRKSAVRAKQVRAQAAFVTSGWGDRHWLIIVALVGATIAAYWPALLGNFIWDDDTFVLNNPLVKASDGLYRIWFTTQPADYWPLTNTSFWLEWRLWGVNPTGYHCTNLLLHIGSTLLLFRGLQKLGVPGAGLAAMLFALHPVNV